MPWTLFGLRLCVFSAVEGQVVKEGVPVPNALIKRSYGWNDGTITDETTTDKDGHFSFGNLYRNSLLAMFPHNPAIVQFIKIYVDDKEYQAWGYGKDNYDINGELDGKPLKMHCDLNNPQEKHALEHYKMYSGICELR